ncbi:MAG: hypothetical protein WA867_22895 [Candidatus Acidiferrales bacterium]
MDMYLHVRVLFSIILGLGISRLLTGVARIVQHPKQYRVYWVLLLWAGFVFLYLINFWWWEYRLATIQRWTFPLYFFIAIYAVLLFLLCVLLFPDEMADYDGFKAYCYSRRQWIFGVMTVVFVADIADTLIKGGGYLRALGPPYYVRAVLSILLCAAAIKIKDQRFHAAFAIFATAFEIALIFRSYMTIG